MMKVFPDSSLGDSERACKARHATTNSRVLSLMEKEQEEQVYKPGSVPPSFMAETTIYLGLAITGRLQQATRGLFVGGACP